MPEYRNSEGERIEITDATAPAWKDCKLLILHDDPPPAGSGIAAPMLLDDGTKQWLLEQLGASHPAVAVSATVLLRRIRDGEPIGEFRHMVEVCALAALGRLDEVLEDEVQSA